MNATDVPYELEERTLAFAANVRVFVKQFPKKLEVMDDLKQVLRSSGSVGANYIEANESLSDKDLVHRMKIVRKEAKESHYWLRLLEPNIPVELCAMGDSLRDEARQLVRIFSSIIEKKMRKS